MKFLACFLMLPFVLLIILVSKESEDFLIGLIVYGSGVLFFVGLIMLFVHLFK